MTIYNLDYCNFCGIYRIINIQNYKFYIGMTTRNFKQRFDEHIKKLRKNKHYNPMLQNSFNKYGEDSFIFEAYLPYENATFQNLENIEKQMINDWASSGALMNIQFSEKYYVFGADDGAKIRESCKKIVQLDKNNNLLNTFNSAAEASRLTGINRGDIGAYARGKSRAVFVGNCKWVFLDNYNKGLIPESREYEIKIRKDPRVVIIENSIIMAIFASCVAAAKTLKNNPAIIRSCANYERDFDYQGRVWRFYEDLSSEIQATI